MAVLFCVAALLVSALALVLRRACWVGLEPLAKRLDRWRRPWFYPERELGWFLTAWLALSLVSAFSLRYALPRWSAWLVFGVWALHVPADLLSWLRTRKRRALHLHQRGFRLLELGPLWLRGVIGLAAAAAYLLAPPLQAGLEAGAGRLVDQLERFLF